MAKKIVSTTNSEEDVDLMIAWLNGCTLKAQIAQSERNVAIQEEIEACIRSTLSKKK